MTLVSAGCAGSNIVKVKIQQPSLKFCLNVSGAFSKSLCKLLIAGHSRHHKVKVRQAGYFGRCGLESSLFFFFCHTFTYCWKNLS